MKTEYDYINNIGTTHETYTNMTDKIMNEYYHKREVASVSELLQLLLPKNREDIIDIGISIGTWLNDYHNFGFKKITGIDISEERAKKAFGYSPKFSLQEGIKKYVDWYRSKH